MSINPVEDLFVRINNAINGTSYEGNKRLANLLVEEMEKNPEVLKFLLQQIADASLGQIGEMWNHISRTRMDSTVD